MKNHIKIVSRYDPRYFANRVNRIYAAKPDLTIDWSKDVAYIPVPDDLIVCDVCNAEIGGEEVKLLMVDGHVWGTVCEGCELKYHSKLQVVRDVDSSAPSSTPKEAAEG